MKIKNSKVLRILAAIIMAVVLVIVFVIGESQMQKMEPTETVKEETTELSKTENYDSSNDATVEQNLLYNVYDSTDGYLQLKDDETYIYLSDNNMYYFTGTFEYVNGNDVFQTIPRLELFKYGLNFSKINSENLYYIKAYFDNHKFKSGDEFYIDDIHETKKNYFEFLVYFRENANGEFIVAVRPIRKSQNINFEESYF